MMLQAYFESLKINGMRELYQIQRELKNGSKEKNAANHNAVTVLSIDENWKVVAFENLYHMAEYLFEIPSGLTPKQKSSGVKSTTSRQIHNLHETFVSEGMHLFSTEFSWSSPAEYTRLSFSAVTAEYYVWLNGVFLGYRDNVNLKKHLDASCIIKNGQNRLAVLVINELNRGGIKITAPNPLLCRLECFVNHNNCCAQ